MFISISVKFMGQINKNLSINKIKILKYFSGILQQLLNTNYTQYLKHFHCPTLYFLCDKINQMN